MNNLNSVSSELKFINTLKFIAQAYEEISVMRMRRIRASVLSARDFMNKLTEVFYDLKTSYKDNIVKIVAKNKKQNTELNQDKTLTILISTGNTLYGDIVKKVFNRFYEETKTQNTDILILGQIGRNLYDRQPDKKSYLYFDIPDAEVGEDYMRIIIQRIMKYNQISVYYAQFDTIFKQLATVSNITGDTPYEVKKDSTEKVKYNFEPGIEKVLAFFQTQVFNTLFKITIQEGHLAHFGSRINAMEEALQHIETRSEIVYSRQRRLHRMIENKKDLERIAGRNIWFKK